MAGLSDRVDKLSKANRRLSEVELGAATEIQEGLERIEAGLEDVKVQPAIDQEVSWWDDEDLFRSEVAQGHAWERWVATWLKLNGLSVEVQEQTVRDGIEDRDRYSGTTDLIVEGKHIEVKSRRFAFSSAPDPVFVMPVRDWELYREKPWAVVIVFRFCGTMKAVPGVEVPRLETRTAFDKIVRQERDSYAVRKAHMRSMNTLADALRNPR